MIQFQCEHCGRKLRVSESSAGRTGRCPNCKGRIAIPAAPGPAVVPDMIAVSETTTPGVINKQLFDLSQPQSRVDGSQDPETPLSDAEAIARLGLTPAPEYTGQRQFPWPLDILLYPANLAGLTFLAIVVVIPIFLDLFLMYIPLLAGFIFGLLDFLFSVLIRLYAIWYYAECVHDSAQGGVRAPMALDMPDPGTMLSRILYLIAVSGLFVAPVAIYGIWFSRFDAVFWGLAAWAVVFFPIGLLAMVINDSTSSLNPLFLLGSILRTFVPYLGLLLMIAMLVSLHVLIQGLLTGTSWFLDILGALIGTYSYLIMSHVLGRFYWRYRDRLDWGL